MWGIFTYWSSIIAPCAVVIYTLILVIGYFRKKRIGSNHQENR
ncbi:hypothetical protein SAMN05444416_10511 [Thermoactinomyces sp. DSM 45892]|nr:hypothetical protein SAMN05444416_10511 [Thermoactinomyces sp. DSM 45892]